MRRILFVISLMAVFGGAGFAQNPKLDHKLNQLLSSKNPNGKIRVIIQRTAPVSAADNQDIQKRGGKVLKTFGLLKAHVIEIAAPALKAISNLPDVTNISIDEVTVSHMATTEPSIVSGAQMATQRYGVTGAGIGVA